MPDRVVAYVVASIVLSAVVVFTAPVDLMDGVVELDTHRPGVLPRPSTDRAVDSARVMPVGE